VGLLTKTANRIKNLGVKELTPKESIQMFKNLAKTSKVPIQKHIKSGNLITFVYNAKDKTQDYDKTPFVLVLSSTSKYMLGLNFHWMPVNRRMMLVDYLLSTQTKQIRNKMPFKVSYRKLKSFINKLGAYPVVRLYIRSRMSSTGVKVPEDQMMQAAKMKAETFTKGKKNSTTLWTRAQQKARALKKKYFR